MRFHEGRTSRGARDRPLEDPEQRGARAPYVGLDLRQRDLEFFRDLLVGHVSK